MNSRNHIMLGSIGAWLYTDVLGIDQATGSSGYTSLLLWPRVTVHEALPSASGSFDSVRGRIELAWANLTTSFTIDATVPTNVAAEVRLPFPAASAATLAATEGGRTFYSGGAYVSGVPGIVGASIDAASGTLAVRVGSGAFAFAATW
jgi:hypothetical protein